MHLYGSSFPEQLAGSDKFEGSVCTLRGDPVEEQIALGVTLAPPVVYTPFYDRSSPFLLRFRSCPLSVGASSVCPRQPLYADFVATLPRPSRYRLHNNASPFLAIGHLWLPHPTHSLKTAPRRTASAAMRWCSTSAPCGPCASWGWICRSSRRSPFKGATAHYRPGQAMFLPSDDQRTWMRMGRAELAALLHREALRQYESQIGFPVRAHSAGALRARGPVNPCIGHTMQVRSGPGVSEPWH